MKALIPQSQLSFKRKLYRVLRFLRICYVCYLYDDQPIPFDSLLRVVNLRPNVPPYVLRAEKTYSKPACQ